MSAAAGAAAPIDTLCMGCSSAACDFKPLRLQRRPLGEGDVLVEMKYCGICHSDARIARGAIESVAGKVAYPIVPGHELAGVCTAVGPGVTKFKVGDQVGVGCMVDSCLQCAACLRGEEQKCAKGNTATYNGRDKHGRAATYPKDGATLGGYTTQMVVHERFGIKLPQGYPLEYAGPVMCAGVTLYDPLRRYGAKAGTKVGVVGVGGLGQMGMRIAKAMGCVVTAISRSEGKRTLAMECGADTYVPSSDDAAMKAAEGTLDLVLNTIPSNHDYHAYSKLCNKSGKHIILGLNDALGAAMMVDGLTFGASRVKMSGIGGIQATQEVVDLCAAHNIKPAVKIIAAEEINGVYEELELGNDTGLRHVLDISTLNEEAFAKCTRPAPDFSKAHAQGMSIGGMLGTAVNMLFCCKWM